MVLAVCILGDGDGEAVGYDDEMLGCTKVHVVWEVGLGVRAGEWRRAGGVMLVGHGHSRRTAFFR